MQEEMTGVRGDFVEQIVAESGSFLNTAVAFANGRGGRIIFYGESGRGFSAEAELIPCIDEITQKIFDSCEPRIFPRVGVELQDGRQVVVVEIFPGMEKPYFVKELGMMDGTYVRVGGATRLAEPYQVQELLLSGTNSSADQLAAESTVSDVEIEEFCRMMYGEAEKRRADDDVVRLQKEDLLAWKLLREEEGERRATGGWHLLSGTAEELFPEGFIQCAEYLGATRLDFVGGEEFAGSLAEQVDGAADYMQERLLARGLTALPEDLMRRLLARAVCQRNYAAPGRISLVLYEDRLEITVPGLLEEDMTIWKLKTGFSKIRNRAIAAAFLYMGMMTGFQSILPELYRAAKRARLPEPAVITLGDSVRINLYCRAEEEAQQQESVVEETELVQTVEAAEEAEPVQEQELVGEAELVQDVEPVEKEESVQNQELVGEAELVQDVEPVEIVEPVQEQDPVEETELAEEAESVQEVEPIEEAEPIREEEPLPEEIEEEPAPLQEESGAGDVLASGNSLEDGQDARLVQEMEADHEPDFEPAPELKLELESLADLKADDVALEEEPAEPREEKVSAGQQELSFDAEEPAGAIAEESAKEIVKEVLEKPVKVSSEESMEERLLHVIRENPKVTQKALKEALGVSIATVKRMTTALHKAGVIERTGTNRSGEWHILKD
ncbi:ATP-binding protein [Selenomonas sputigena]|uniref:ATP-binding protein n=1 Tax=Selenomonas sputigena TaxID=69823 RepID=UPI00222E54EA|nr:ATP-binding protein [Selenomonas sputigena]UZD44027.1 MarR family transcriptional regulator [Selenomonas sputigena]